MSRTRYSAGFIAEGEWRGYAMRDGKITETPDTYPTRAEAVKAAQQMEVDP